MTDNETLIEEVEERREQLISEYGEDEYDIIEINEILRDEFSEDKYKQTLIDLGINDDDEELGLETNDLNSTIDDLNSDEKKDNILKTMLINKPHIYQIALTLLGYDNDIFTNKPKYTGKSLIPLKDAKFMLGVISSLYHPQTLSGKLGKNISLFDDHYNMIINNFRVRLEDYSDDICSAKDLRIAVDMFLNEVNVVRSAIINGRLGDLTRDVTINSHNEKEDLSGADNTLDKLKKELKV